MAEGAVEARPSVTFSKGESLEEIRAIMEARQKDAVYRFIFAVANGGLLRGKNKPRTLSSF